jgi:phage tail sheath protein FI
MALFTPSESPAVVVKEIDLTGGVPNVQSTTGAYVGNFRWGPANERVLISNEEGLVETFASPDASNNRDIDFVSAAQFLRYSNSLQVVRVATSAAKNAHSSTKQQASDAALSAPDIENDLEFDNGKSALDSDGHTFIGKFLGDLGNGLRVSVCPPDSAAFSSWTYKSSFDTFPGTSTYATNKSASNDEIHVAVVDLNGEFSGTKGTVLETYPFVSVGTDAKNTDGTTNYAIDVINERSEYIKMVNFDSDYQLVSAGTTIDSGDNFNPSLTTATNYAFEGGVNSATLTTGEYATGFDFFNDKDVVEVDFLIAPSLVQTSDQATVVNDLVATAGTLRKDCMVVTSPARNDIVGKTNSTSITNGIVVTADTFTKSSYLTMDGNFLKIYDKYNDQYLQIPAASSTAGIMAATDRNAAPWFSPAGGRRGQYLGITAIDYTPTKTERDTLYKAGVNPIANIPGQGIVLFGDKTKLARPSAFDRINVRRLFLVLERAISRAAESVLFEFNDEFTRAEFVNIVEPVLREVKGRRGITDFRVVCDETNNTAAVIDRNEFIASIFIKPARSINYVTLNFVAVRTGVDFEEVVGTV